MPEQYTHFGGGATSSTLHPLVLVAMFLTILLMFCLPRRYVLIPFFLCVFMVPLGQQAYLLGVHWFVSRILVLAGLIRTVLPEGEDRFAGGFNAIDQAFIACAVIEAISVVLRNLEGIAALNQVGFLIDTVGAYVVLRSLIRDEADIRRALKCFAVLTAILGIEMVREQYTLQNLFGLLGGVRAVPEIREGRIRSQGVFQHELTAGTSAAALIPLFFVLWQRGKSKLLAGAGLVGCTLMTVTSNSSTPLLAYAASLVAIILWPIRKYMRAVRWGIVFTLVVANFIMTAPVWFIIAHIDLTGGSSGYHRAEVIDQFFRHFGDWWLMGTGDAGNWGVDMWDVQNQFVQIGEAGGLIAFILYLRMVSQAFGKLGSARKAAEGSPQEWTIWLVGASLFANCVGFFGVNYFDQSKVIWFTLLAMICAVTPPSSGAAHGTEIKATEDAAPPSRWGQKLLQPL